MALGLHDDALLAEPAASADESRGKAVARLETEPLAQVHQFVEHPRGVEDGLGSPFCLLVKGNAQLHEQRLVITRKGSPKLLDRWKIGRAHEVLAVGFADRDLAFDAHALVHDDVGGIDELHLRGAFFLQRVDDLLELLRLRLCGRLQ